jgi:hypothetical protein
MYGATAYGSGAAAHHFRAFGSWYCQPSEVHAMRLKVLAGHVLWVAVWLLVSCPWHDVMQFLATAAGPPTTCALRVS